MNRAILTEKIKAAQDAYNATVNKLAQTQAELNQLAGYIEAYNEMLAAPPDEENSDDVERTVTTE